MLDLLINKIIITFCFLGETGKGGCQKCGPTVRTRKSEKRNY